MSGPGVAMGDLSSEAREILALSARGLSTEEVAAHLGMTPETVRRHLAGALAALGACSKLEAVVLALRRGLITLRIS